MTRTVTADTKGPDADPANVARLILLRQLTARPRTRAQLREALRKRNVPDDVAEQALDRFVEVGLIDDAAYAQAVVRSEAGSGGLSRRRVRQRLVQHGLDEELVARTVADIAEQDEDEAALEFARRKVVRWSDADPATRRRRLTGLLARRGYRSETVHRVVREVLEVDAAAD